MYQRKDMKKRAKKSLKKHYLIFLSVCMIAAIWGAKYGISLNLVKLPISTVRVEQNILASSGTNTVSSGLTDAVNGASITKLLKKVIGERFANNSEMLGHSRGVLASIVNMVSSGTITITLVSGIASMVGSENLAMVIVIFLSTLLMLFFWIFGVNVYAAVSARIFLEGRIYENISIDRTLFFLKIRKWMHVSWIMLLKAVYQVLWSLTIVGGFIKAYSYRMVPYIAAENPSIPAREAIALSRKMMDGHKWECFLLDLSFLGWSVLNLLTFGLSGLFFSNPYTEATFSEYYAHLRQIAQVKVPDASRFFIDRYLFEKPGQEEIRGAYANQIDLLQTPQPQPEERRGVSGFIARVFGVVLYHDKQEREYHASVERQEKIRSVKSELSLSAYPMQLCPIPRAEKRSKDRILHSMRHYSIWSLILMFFCFNIFGWVWEVSFHLITYGSFVNRGLLHGPWLPIYGTGGVLILTLLNKFRQKPLVEFALATLLCGSMEYFASWVIEITHGGQRWWDYRGYFLNLHGRICAEGVLIFGLGGIAAVYVFAPMLDNIFRKIKLKVLIPICILLLSVYFTDQVYSIKHPNAGEGISTNFTEQSD